MDRVALASREGERAWPVELTQRRFPDVDPAFANDEGEGDRTLAYWRKAHETYSSRLGQFTPDMLLRCERFRVVEIIDGSLSGTQAGS